MMKLLHGVTSAMVTRFKKNGKIDFDRKKQLTTFLVARGVHCLYPLGTTGECLGLQCKKGKRLQKL
jgi:4-hydroxy-tetrahydrodipicolinate synthase